MRTDQKEQKADNKNIRAMKRNLSKKNANIAIKKEKNIVITLGIINIIGSLIK